MNDIIDIIDEYLQYSDDSLTESEIEMIDDIWRLDEIGPQHVIGGLIGADLAIKGAMVGTSVVGLKAIYQWARRQKSGCARKCKGQKGEDKRVCTSKCLKDITDQKRKRIAAARAKAKRK